MTKVLLVQSYWGKNKWGFPKGKLENEEPHQCAIREVKEETGFDISEYIVTSASVASQAGLPLRSPPRPSPPPELISPLPRTPRKRPRTPGRLSKAKRLQLRELFGSDSSEERKLPTYGAIILNEDVTKVLLVQSYWGKNKWGFPKGKLDCRKEPYQYAVREVREETGFDITKYIKINEYIESTINDKIIRLYIIICDLSLDTKFKPQTREEIMDIRWFDVSTLPTTIHDATAYGNTGSGPAAFSMVVPFVE
ncbi:mRNA-decapping enzyme 2 [Cyphomyrmex costatus]|uniref:mRNA-decapping enzyme 2 n=1 Tax=Cyphomyrmex costatus TaxID=456900 RepID=A0A151I8J3_9HYME|nr:mRNA-decapping enzyme 2 [Cyphomyrmex costatus]